MSMRELAAVCAATGGCAMGRRSGPALPGTSLTRTTRLWPGGNHRRAEAAFARRDLLQHGMGPAAESGDRRLDPGLAGQVTHIGNLCVVYQRHHRAVGSRPGGAPGPV